MDIMRTVAAICLLVEAVVAGFIPPAAVLSTRQSGLLDCLANKSVPLTVSTSANWTDFVTSYNIRLQYDPVVIIIPETTQQVSDSVICASLNGIKVQAKSGGHSYASTSSGGRDGSMVVDLRRFQDVTVHEATGVACVGGGLRLGNMALVLLDKGRALAHGTCAGVGVGGHFTLGGYGYTSRAWGMALDQIVGLDVVQADGSIVYASESENSDLYYVSLGSLMSYATAIMARGLTMFPRPCAVPVHPLESPPHSISRLSLLQLSRPILASRSRELHRPRASTERCPPSSTSRTWPKTRQSQHAT